MSATDQMRSLLDEFMGTSRNGEDAYIEFDNLRVCKSYLLDCCPHEILAGTRMDIGVCNLIHNPAHKADYRKTADCRKYQYELDALDYLNAFVRESDHRTEVAKMKLKETQEELTDEASQKIQHINILSEKIGTTLAKAEQLGEGGQVEESLELMKEVENLHAEKAKFENDLRTAIPTSTYQQQKLRVCEVCSAYLGVHDNDRRLADHFGGKLHLGFIEIRNKLRELKKFIEDNNIVRNLRSLEPSRSEREREIERERERERIREIDRELERERHHRRRRSRSRSRSRSRNKRRDHHRKSKHSHRHHRHSS